MCTFINKPFTLEFPLAIFKVAAYVERHRTYRSMFLPTERKSIFEEMPWARELGGEYYGPDTIYTLGQEEKYQGIGAMAFMSYEDARNFLDYGPTPNRASRWVLLLGTAPRGATVYFGNWPVPDMWRELVKLYSMIGKPSHDQAVIAVSRATFHRELASR